MPPAPKSPLHAQAVFWLVVANVCWGISFAVIKGIGSIQEATVPGSNTWFISACVIAPRFAFAAAMLGLVCWRMVATLTWPEIRQGLKLGAFTGAGMIFQIDGLQYTSASTSAFLTQFYAIMIPVWLALRHRRSPPALVWLCCAMVLAGAGVLAHLDWHDLRLGRGELETLISSVFFMGQILALDTPEAAGFRPLAVTFAMFVTQALIGGALGLVTAPAGVQLHALAASGMWWVLIGALTVFCTLGAFTLMNVWQPKITATEAGLIYCGEPVFAAAMALILPGLISRWGGIDYPNEQATLNLLVGGGLITAANVLLQLRPPAKSQAGV